MTSGAAADGRLRAAGRAAVVATLVLVACAAFAVPARVRIPRVVPRPPGTPAAAFSHVRHAVMGCYACHPGVFPQALVGFTHREMRQGRYCGSCHDGAHAMAIEAMACGECHAEP